VFILPVRICPGQTLTGLRGHQKMYKIKQITKLTRDLREIEKELITETDHRFRNQMLLLAADVFLAKNTREPDKAHASYILRTHQPLDTEVYCCSLRRELARTE